MWMVGFQGMSCITTPLPGEGAAAASWGARELSEQGTPTPGAGWHGGRVLTLSRLPGAIWQ